MQPHEFIILEVARERERQMKAEGWSPEHDDGHRAGELGQAAACYAEHGSGSDNYRLVTGAGCPPVNWPWAEAWWKPKDRRRDLIRAAALIVAEIERLDRLPDAEARRYAWAGTNPDAR